MDCQIKSYLTLIVCTILLPKIIQYGDNSICKASKESTLNCRICPHKVLINLGRQKDGRTDSNTEYYVSSFFSKRRGK